MSESESKTRPRGNRRAKKRTLVIVESPDKAETIGRFLGDDYVVDASRRD